MKDLIGRILSYVPQYLSEFGLLFAGPKRFMRDKNTRAETTLRASLVFGAVSLVVVVVMTAPLLPPGVDLWTHVGSRAISSLLTVTLGAIALRGAWRMVGGKANVRSFFVTYAYFFGVVLVVLTFFQMLGEGVFKVLAPELYVTVREAQLNREPLPDLTGTVVPIVSYGVRAAGFVAASIWGFISWGAYRELNGVGKARSGVALFVMGVLSWLIGAVVFFVSAAMTQA